MPEVIRDRWAVPGIACIIGSGFATALPHVAGLAPPFGLSRSQLGFTLGVAVFAIGLMLLGLALHGRLAGWMVDGKVNRMDLSRFQFGAWTAVIFPAIATMVWGNFVANRPDPFAIAIPEQLFAMLGISIGAVGATAFIKRAKASDDPDLDRVPPSRRDAARVGVLTRNETPRQALFGDIVTGDEIVDSTSMSAGKVQFLYASAIVLGAYAYLIWRALGPAGPFAFPPLSDGMAGLLLLSATGFAGVSLVPKTPTPPPE